MAYLYSGDLKTLEGKFGPEKMGPLGAFPAMIGWGVPTPYPPTAHGLTFLWAQGGGGPHPTCWHDPLSYQEEMDLFRGCCLSWWVLWTSWDLQGCKLACLP